MGIFMILGGVAILVALWMNMLASISLKHDDMLEPFQKKAQFIIVWLFPFIDASIILHLIFEHSPNAIPKKWIPWPFKGMIFGKDIKPNKDRDENELDYCRSNYIERNIGGDISDGD